MRVSLPVALCLILLGLFLLAAPLSTGWWEGWLRPLVYDAAGKMRPDGVPRTVGLFFFRHLYNHLVMWPLGTMLILAGLAQVVGTRLPWSRNRLTRSAQVAGALTTAAGLLLTLPLFLLGEGTQIRPLGWVLLIAPAVFAGLLAALLTGLPALLHDQPRFPAVVGFLLCLAPLPAALALLGTAMGLLGLTLGT